MVDDKAYKGLAPYGEDDSELFFGRTDEVRHLRDRVLASRVTVLYGPSGVGKSSLLRAGLAAELTAENARARRAGRPPPHTVAVVRDWSNSPGSQLSDAVASARHTMDLGEHDIGQCVLILDQLEDLARDDGQIDRAAVAAILACGADEDVPVHLVFGVREDALSILDVFRTAMPRLLTSLRRLDHLDDSAAEEAILGPLRRMPAVDSKGRPVPVDAERQLVRRILDDVAVGKVDFEPERAARREIAPPGPRRIETPMLQLVLERLFECERASGSDRLREETYSQLGGAQGIALSHVDRIVRPLPHRDRATAARVFYQLVTSGGTRIALTIADLAERTRRSPEEITRVVTPLEGDARLLRLDDQGRYEPFHEVLGEALLGWRSQFLAQRRKRALQLIAAAGGLAAAAAALWFWHVSTQNDKLKQQRATLTGQLSVLGLRRVLVVGSPVDDVAIKANGSSVVAADAGGGVRLWNWAGLQLGTMPHTPAGGPARAVQFSPDGRAVLAAVGTGAWLWNPSRDSVRRVATSAAGVTSVAYAAGGLVAVGTRARGAEGGTVILLRMPGAHQCARWVWPGGDSITRLQFAQGDERLLGVAENDLRVWQLTGCERHLIAHLGSPTLRSAALSPNGQSLAAGLADGNVGVWPLETVERGADILIPSLVGHTGAVLAVAFAGDSNHLVTSSSDRTARVWNWVGTGSGRHWATCSILPSNDAVTASAMTATSPSRVATGSYDRTTRLWAPSICAQ